MRTQEGLAWTAPTRCCRLLTAAAAACRLPPAWDPLQVVLLSAAAAWLVFCTWMFHGMLEVQMSVGNSAEVTDVPPTDRTCNSWLLRTWCEKRVARFRAEAVRQGMLHAWSGYKAFAWGADEIHPKSKSAKTDIMVGAAVRPGQGPRLRVPRRGWSSSRTGVVPTTACCLL